MTAAVLEVPDRNGGEAVVFRISLRNQTALWRSAAGKNKLSANTRRVYASHLELCLIPHLGRIPLERLRVDHATAMFDTIAPKRRTRPGRPIRLRCVLSRIAREPYGALSCELRVCAMIGGYLHAEVERVALPKSRSRVWRT